MKRKETKKYLARNLRRKGKSYSEIFKVVNVSKSTLSLWLRDIPLTKEQKEKLQGRYKSRYIGSKKRQQTRIELTKKIIREAKSEVKDLVNNKLFLAGLMLYWAEGTKRGEEMISFSNSDPNMIKFMMKWFRKICLVPERKFRIQIHIHSLHKERNIKEYWSKQTKIPLNQFHKLIIKRTSLKHRKNKLYQGTCCIRVCDKNLFRKIMGWKIGVLEEFGLEDSYQIPK
jgi:transcriptional regulator with XRE-family HTH domain